MLAQPFGAASLSMVLDARDQPHLSYVNTAYRIDYHYSDGVEWHTEPVLPDAEGERRGAALGLDAAGAPAIAYIEDIAPFTTRLVLATRSPAGWQGEVVTETEAQPGLDGEAGLAFDRAGAIHLAFWREGRLEHAWRDDGAWQFEPIDAQTDGGSLSIVADAAGRLLVAYIDSRSNDARLAELLPDDAERLFLPLIVR